MNTRLGLRVFRFIAGYAVPPGASFVVSPKRSLRCPSVGRAGRSRTVECLGRRGVAAGEREEGLPALGPDPIRDDDASSSNRLHCHRRTSISSSSCSSGSSANPHLTAGALVASFKPSHVARVRIVADGASRC